MNVIATLIAADGLSRETVRDIAGAAGLVGAFAWIDDGLAGDFTLSAQPDELPGLRTAFEAAISSLNVPVDVVVQPQQNRQKSLLIADMDSTMITVECIDELADYAGIKPEIAAITERAMRGELDFRAALAERVACLAGLPETVIDQCLAERVQPMPGARTLLRTFAAQGGQSVLVSGGFTRFADPVAQMIGFHRAIANVLEIADGKLTGRVLEPVIDSAAKLATLHAECARLGISAADVLAIGDGSNDGPMLRAAGLGVAYHGHPAAVAAADAAIRYGDHRVLLWAMGIEQARWVLD